MLPVLVCPSLFHRDFCVFSKATELSIEVSLIRQKKKTALKTRNTRWLHIVRLVTVPATWEDTKNCKKWCLSLIWAWTTTNLTSSPQNCAKLSSKQLCSSSSAAISFISIFFFIIFCVLCALLLSPVAPSLGLFFFFNISLFASWLLSRHQSQSRQ